MQERHNRHSSRSSGDGQTPSNAPSRSGRDNQNSQARNRAVPYPSSRTNGKPAGHSGRIPRQAQAGSTNTSRTATPTRSRQASHASASRPSRARTSFSEEPSAPFQQHDRYLRVTKKPKRTGLRLAAVLASLGFVALVGFGIFFFIQSLPANITLNGASLKIRGEKTLSDALSASGIRPQPGDLVAVDGSLLETGKGEPFSATINGTSTTDPNAKLASGDVVEIGNGVSREEPSKALEAAIPWEVQEVGSGAIHLVEGTGADGVKATKTGEISGITAEQVLQEPSHIVRRNVSPQVGDDKVIALTFDDGPWSDQTSAVLDVLAQHGAKATFFTVGNRIEMGNGAELMKRAASEGHQICSHSYDHASGSGQSVNLGYMTPEEQVAEVQKGLSAIEAATGTPASRVFRTPGGNFGPEVVSSIGPHITSEIGWNIDSGDWRKPGPAAIASEIENAWSGAVVLLHDGGGERSQTVEALKTALPRMKEQGYRFITMDELLAYPME